MKNCDQKKNTYKSKNNGEKNRKKKTSKERPEPLHNYGTFIHLKQM